MLRLQYAIPAARRREGLAAKRPVAIRRSAARGTLCKCATSGRKEVVASRERERESSVPDLRIRYANRNKALQFTYIRIQYQYCILLLLFDLYSTQC